MVYPSIVLTWCGMGLAQHKGVSIDDLAVLHCGSECACGVAEMAQWEERETSPLDHLLISPMGGAAPHRPGIG